ncbi:MAG: GNAT family N-acetyltransferase [Oscillospiraceae bacterium]|jgi:RimJ/RimL family protein N-acetyltransferase|nr:GNAT family N-acetyltransferase [Oscillospiraceae bacterium]
MDIALREWKLTDAADVAAMVGNRKVQDNLRDGFPYPYTVADAETFIRGMLGAERDSVYAFAIADGGRAIGSIGAFRKTNIHSRTAEMGYYVAEPYWGRGVATAAVRLICKYVFERTDIIRVFAEPFAHNAASCRVLEKAGFRLEGTMRQNAVKNGAVLDMKLYAILAQESL